jgi:hypothetical protein
MPFLEVFAEVPCVFMNKSFILATFPSIFLGDECLEYSVLIDVVPLFNLEKKKVFELFSLFPLGQHILAFFVDSSSSA